MCPTIIPASCDGEHCHVDHIIPYKLRPDLSYDIENMQLVCIPCHNQHCQSIEASHWPDAQMIAEAKARAGEQW